MLRFETAARRDPAIDAWFESRAYELGIIARPWFERMRQCGSDVRELLDDGHPTACVGDAAFGYVNAFSAHVNVGFFLGAHLADPSGLLEGTGKNMPPFLFWLEAGVSYPGVVVAGIWMAINS